MANPFFAKKDAAPGKGPKSGPPAKGKKGVNPFAKKGAAPAGKGAPAKGKIDPNTLGSMVNSLKS